MSESKSPTNFITPSAIDNLSIAGISVWFICITISSIVNNLESFWIRIIAICISLVWSISLFVKNKRWNKASNYIIVIVNAVFIYVNAAGINTITRQMPFEGYGVKTDLSETKNKLIKSTFFDLSKQKNWYPDYKLFLYVDTLQSKIIIENKNNEILKNQFSYIKDNINNITTNNEARTKMKSFLKDFGKSKIDSLDFAIMKNQMQFVIDSLTGVIEFNKKYPDKEYVERTFEIEGKSFNSYEILDKYFEESNKKIRLINLLNFIKKTKQTPSAIIDSTLNDL
jgi:hypothetical protein